MNNSSKVPPRFVPTLTEVVPVEAGDEGAAAQKLEPTLDDTPAEAEPADVAPSTPSAPSAPPLASFHSPWLADGLYARNKPAGIPHDLPPLPESLPPQQPFAYTAVEPAFELPQEGVLPDKQEPVFAPEPVQELAQQESPQGLDAEDAGPALDVGQAVQVSEEIYAEPDSTEPEDLAWNEQAPQVTEEYLVHRLMQRVDLILEQRLKEAIAVVVQEQTRSLVPRLREEVESVVRQSVYEAVESELAQQIKARPDR